MSLGANASQIERAYGLFQAGHLQEAVAILKPLHAQEPSNHLVTHLLGLASVMQGEQETGLELLRQSVELMPANPQYAENYVSSLLQTGRATKAVEACDAILTHVPQALSMLRLKALALCELNELGRARVCYDSLISKVPDSAELVNERGVVHARLGQWKAAQADFSASLTLNPSFDQAHYNLGNLFLEQGQLAQALQATDKAIAANARYVQAWNNRGLICLAMRQLPQALEAFDKAAALHDAFVEAHNNRGVVLRELARQEEALLAFDRALAIDPSYADAYLNKAYALYELGRIAEAIAACEKTVALKPDHAQARLALVTFRLPVVPASRAESEAAVGDFMRGISAFATWAQAHPQVVAQAIGRSQPFYLAYRAQDLTMALCAYGDMATKAMAAQWGELAVQASVQRPRIRLLIISGHIFRHAVWEVILKGYLAHIDHSKFEIIICNTSAKTDQETPFAQGHCDTFHQGPKSVHEWIELIRQAEPDVIFYPEIGMDPIVCSLAALRLARLQVASWGHPLTSGMPTIDLFVSGELLEPEGAEAHYREKLVRLPRTGVCIAPNESPAQVFEPAKTAPVVRFALCHQPFKFDPADDELYVQIAREVGPCEFWLVRPPHLSWALDALLIRLSTCFEAAGLDSDAYLKVANWMSEAQFAGFLDAMDIYLDSPSFSGYTTAWAALQRGLPVLTLEGAFMRQRLAGGLLRQIGLNDDIASTRADYLRKAVQWSAECGGGDTWSARRHAIQQASAQAAQDVETVRAFERAILSALEV